MEFAILRCWHLVQAPPLNLRPWTLKP